VVRRRIIPWHEIVDVGFPEFRQLDESLRRPAVITSSQGPVRLPGVEPSAPLIRRPEFTALARVERVWRDAVASRD
jgi:hypothetical protein